MYVLYFSDPAHAIIHLSKAGSAKIDERTGQVWLSSICQMAEAWLQRGASKRQDKIHVSMWPICLRKVRGCDWIMVKRLSTYMYTLELWKLWLCKTAQDLIHRDFVFVGSLCWFVPVGSAVWFVPVIFCFSLLFKLFHKNMWNIYKH